MDQRESIVNPSQTCKASSADSRQCMIMGKGISCMVQTNKRIVLEVLTRFEIDKVPQLQCSEEATLKAKVIVIQDRLTNEVTQPLIEALKSFNWMNYGLTLHGCQVKSSDDAFVEFNCTQYIRGIDIVLHRYQESYSTTQCKRKSQVSEILNIKEALRTAMNQLKADYPMVFLSKRANKIKMCVPELSRCLSGLIFSSNDVAFQEECANILKMLPEEFNQETVENCINQKVCNIIESSDNLNKKKPIKSAKKRHYEELKEQESNDTPEEASGNFRSIWSYL